MPGIESLREAFNSILAQYKSDPKHNYNKNKTITAQNLLDYAIELGRAGANIFDSWDNIFDNDGIKGNSISGDRYYADGNNLMFQTETGQIIAYNLKTGNLEIATNGDLASLLDALDDGVNGSITEDILADGTLKLGKDRIEFFDSYKLIDTGVQDSDNTNKSVTMSSKTIEDLVKQMAQSVNMSVNDLMDKIKKGDINSVLTSPDAAKFKDIIKNYLTSNFGGSVDKVLKQLLDMDVDATVSGFLTQNRSDIFNQIVDRVLTKVVEAYQNHDPKKGKDGQSTFDIDEIKAATIDFSDFANKKLTVAQIQVDNNGNVIDPEFIQYLKTKTGKDIRVGDNIKIAADGSVTINDVRLDSTTTTQDGTGADAGKFSISASDVQKMLNEIKAGKDPKEVVKNYLNTMFGSNLQAALSKILDEQFSSSAAGYLNQNFRQAAFDKVVDIVVAKVQSAYKDNAGSVNGEISVDMDEIKGALFAKNSDFSGIAFGQKVTPEMIADPKFKEYIKTLYPEFNESRGDRIEVDANGQVKVIMNAQTSAGNTPATGAAAGNPPQVTVSASDIQSLKSQLAGKTQNQQREIISRFLLEKFGQPVAGLKNARTYAGFSGNAVSYTGGQGLPVNGQISSADYEKMMNVVVGLTGLGFNTGGNWDTNQSRINRRVESFYSIVDEFTKQITNANATGNVLVGNEDNVECYKQSNLSATFNLNAVKGQIFTDPIGFDAQNGWRFDFVEDENNDGKFNGIEEFIGADTGWSDFTKYDVDHDGDIEGSELDKLMVLGSNSETGEKKLVSAKEAGISFIDLSSYTQKNEDQENGNILAGTFNLVFNNQAIEGTQTLDSEEYLNDTYGEYFGMSMNTYQPFIDNLYTNLYGVMKNDKNLFDTFVNNVEEVKKRKTQEEDSNFKLFA